MEDPNLLFERAPQHSCKKTIIFGDGDYLSFEDQLTSDDVSNYLDLLNKSGNKGTRFSKRKLTKEQLSLCQELAKWKINVFFTVTLRQGFKLNSGKMKAYELQDVIKLASRIGKQITRAFGGQDRRANFIPFIERNNEGRYHLHIALEAFKPVEKFEDLSSWNPIKVRKILYEISSKIPEIYHQKDFQIIGNPFGLLVYLIKAGTDSYCSEAANLVNLQ